MVEDKDPHDVGRGLKSSDEEESVQPLGRAFSLAPLPLPLTLFARRSLRIDVLDLLPQASKASTSPSSHLLPRPPAASIPPIPIPGVPYLGLTFPPPPELPNILISRYSNLSHMPRFQRESGSPSTLASTVASQQSLLAFRHDAPYAFLIHYCTYGLKGNATEGEAERERWRRRSGPRIWASGMEARGT